LLIEGKLENVITAIFELAGGVAAIAARGVAIVTTLTGIYHPITATLSLAQCTAAVTANIIAVVALLTDLENVVAAEFSYALCAAAVHVEVIAVIALFPECVLEDAITTKFGLAGGIATITWFVISVITLLA